MPRRSVSAATRKYIVARGHTDRRPCRTCDRREFRGARFFDYTAYGDTINVAARLEAGNKQRYRTGASAALGGDK